MYYRMLGNTGLQVSVLSYGFWATFGAKEGLCDQEGVEKAKQCLRVARAGGVNLFDNAEVYGSPRGAAETIMGEAIAQLQKEAPKQWRRSDILITTKIFWGGDGVNEKGLSRKHIYEGVDAACSRLQVDYVDLVFCHRPDPLTPTETIVRAMTEQIRRGKAMAWGTSEWSAQQITEAFWIAKEQGLLPPQFEQPQYNLNHRLRFEQEYAPLYQAPYRLGTTIWSPLASGILTGKYNSGIPEGSRLTQTGYEWLKDVLGKLQKDGTLEKIAKLSHYAEEHFGCSMAQLALAWCVKNPNVSTVLLGATKPSQLEENLAALNIVPKITAEHMLAIDDMMNNKPESYHGYGGRGMRDIHTI